MHHGFKAPISESPKKGVDFWAKLRVHALKFFPYRPFAAVGTDDHHLFRQQAWSDVPGADQPWPGHAAWLYETIWRSHECALKLLNRQKGGRMQHSVGRPRSVAVIGEKILNRRNVAPKVSAASSNGALQLLH